MVMENPEIGRQLKEHANAIRSAGKRAIRDVIEVGRHLTEAKALVGHGGWLRWLECEFGWKDQTARNLMQMYQASLKSPNFGDSNLPLSALYMLAGPNTPSAAVEDVLARCRPGAALKVADVKQVIAKAKSNVVAIQVTDSPKPDPSRPVPDLLASVVTEQAERLSRAIACIEEIAEGEKLIMLQIVERCSDRDLEKAEAAILALLKVIQRVRDERAMEAPASEPMAASCKGLH
jgi:hypothetical protein